jgi:restriction system protein
MLPKSSDLQVPILRVVHESGGTARPEQVYAGVKRLLPQLTDADLAETVSGGESKLENRIRFVRQALINRGELTSPGYGVWAITDRGRGRLGSGPAAAQTKSTVQAPAAIPTPDVPDVAFVNLEESVDNYLEAFEGKVVQALLDLEPARFEQFAAKLLTAYGFRKMKVTNSHTAPDGGIDGDGELRVGLATLRAAFQCKRWKGQVPRPEIDKFRGAIQGKFEHGYFFTTSTFSEDARRASVRENATPVFLFDGSEIVRIMIEKGLGIIRRPVEIYADRIDSLFADD